MSSTRINQVRTALDGVVNPRTGQGLVASGMVAELAVDESSGDTSFVFLLRRDDPATLVRQARQALAAIDITTPKVRVVDPAGAAPASHGPPQSGVAAVPAPAPMTVAGIDRVIAISSGKGGVGKSTVSANVAVELASRGLRVGLMDADFYGPNIPRMLGVYERPGIDANKRILPLEAYGVKLMSIGFLVDRDAPAIWRGPIITKVIQQFLHDVAWGELDYLLVDMPPGTGDAQLSLVQQVVVNGAVVVTTPQEVAVGDALRGAKMFERVNVPVLGVVENMSGFLDPVTGMRHDLFGSGGGARLAEELGVPLLGEVPLQPGLAVAADAGRPVVIEAPDSAAAAMLRDVARRMEERAGEVGVRMPVMEG
ncbi:MAG: Mrp/NBP35 family ATP-binding protein [Gemmatimonadales bacterium]|jgi:ATP-binding protein involved in chromosome partitioning|nr:Mrp/NBP35 family ATP-binding protein [Gemmatimonadales bacterium]